MTNLSDIDRMGGGMRPSRSDFNNYLRTSNVPEYQRGDARYRFLTPEVTAQQGPYPGRPTGIQEVVPGQVPGMPPPGGGIVGQMLAGPPMGGNRTDRANQTDRPMDIGTTSPPTSSWGGTMRPLAIPKGTSLLEMKQMYGGFENDPVLSARREEYDRNLADYLRQVPAWQSREEYEGGLASLPGAGAEILGHIQQRAIENMPVPMRQEWEQKEATRTATSKKLTEAAATEAAYQEFLKTATPDQVKAFHEDYQRTPEGWKPARVTPLERQMAAESSNQEALNALIMNWQGVNGHGNNPFRGGTEESPPAAIPTSDARRQTPDLNQMPPAGPPTRSGQAVISPAAFTDEAGARAAGHKTGDIVLINGRRARLN